MFCPAAIQLNWTVKHPPLFSLFPSIYNNPLRLTTPPPPQRAILVVPRGDLSPLPPCQAGSCLNKIKEAKWNYSQSRQFTFSKIIFLFTTQLHSTVASSSILAFFHKNVIYSTVRGCGPPSLFSRWNFLLSFNWSSSGSRSTSGFSVPVIIPMVAACVIPPPHPQWTAAGRFNTIINIQLRTWIGGVDGVPLLELSREAVEGWTNKTGGSYHRVEWFDLIWGCKKWAFKRGRRRGGWAVR